jgi:hypothetical protein
MAGESTTPTPSTPSTSQDRSRAFEQAFRRGKGDYPAIPQAPASKRTIKPRPKTQREISEEKHEPYDLANLPNPNTPANRNEQATGINFNRSEKISLRDDPTKSYKIGVQDIDEAVFYYFNNVIQPSVMQNGGEQPVPVIYGSPERWKSAQKDGYYRDKGGRIMLPIIVVQRTNLEKDRSVTAKVDSNSPSLYYTLNKGYNSKNFYSPFSVLNNRKPVQQTEMIVVGDFVTMTYECVMQTYYMEQLNKLIESIEYASDSYWGDPERYKFRCFIDGFGSTTELAQSTERLVRGNFTIRLRGQIIPEVKQRDIKGKKAVNSLSKLTVTEETVVDFTNLNI